ncbi:MAG: hypothetical protein A7316_05535 [Candidatus Altiarchaeales archaeon WOR_SM1_86-2]|nr:MAG: hypothetical protein A7316_05535 [Candidatus Altiarchaeales archaeon WOR_SM1_86-2]
MNIEKPRGTRDFAPVEMERRNYARQVIQNVFERYGYSEISIPTFEHTELFALKSGEEIRAEMYVFRDKSDRELCLRPEATASVCRMFAQKLQNLQKPLKLSYFGPMFRYERPQKGRYREFWQQGIELIGAKGVEGDAEVIMAANDALKELGLAFELEVGHLGILRGLMGDLGIEEEKQDELINVVDKKDIARLEVLVEHDVLLGLIELEDSDKEVIERAYSLLDAYPSAINALGELEEILSYLDIADMDYTINLGIARGLEYYTGMVFEIRVPGLGAQDQICGGGRYDRLIELFSGQRMPAVGFAFGFDRVMDAMEVQEIKVSKEADKVVIAPVSKDVRKDAFKIACQLRRSSNLAVDLDLMNRKLNKILDYANNTGARWTVIVGPRELKEDKVVVRDMRTGEQAVINMDGIGAFFGKP